MDNRAADWFARRTTAADDWSLVALLEAKGGSRVSVVVPARNEEATIAEVVSRFAEIAVPVGYGVEFATLLAALQRGGLDSMAQVDLGRRAHRHQSVQPDRTSPDSWKEREIPTAMRPPAFSVKP